jgi:molybdopterin-synthase adenylyltransferase
MTLIKNAHLTRQLSIINSDRLAAQKIFIIGCGAIGSFVGLELAKMGIEQIEVWDNDEVSIENMSNQFFRFSDIGKNKALALKDLIKDFTGVDIIAHPEKFESGTASKHFFASENSIVISAVDSMAVRKLIFDEIKANDLSGFVKLIIDPRMSAEAYLQFAALVDSEKSMANYEKTLYSDENAVQERCTAKSTIYTATLAAGMVTKTVKNIVESEPFAKSIQWDIKATHPDVMAMFAHA